MGKEKTIILKIDRTVDENIKPENIKMGVSILGVDGSVDVDAVDRAEVVLAQIKTALIRKGVDIDDSTPPEEYGNKILELPGGAIANVPPAFFVYSSVKNEYAMQLPHFETEHNLVNSVNTTSQGLEVILNG